MNEPIKKTGLAEAPSILPYDAARLRGLETHIHALRAKGLDISGAVERYEHFCRDAAAVAAEFHWPNPKIVYPRELPISGKIDEIKQAVRSAQVVVVCGDTGSGKTTQLPKIALDMGLGRLGRIACTQPRRIAATGMARRLAQEMEVELGGRVGYQIRLDERVTTSTVVKFMTDGVLLAEMRKDKLLLQYGAIIVDEAHERSLNIDFILGCLKNLLPKRPDLKIIISSATIDPISFSKFFGGAPVVTVSGRLYPIEDQHLPPESDDEDLQSHVIRGLQWIFDASDDGDALVFLPGEREIRGCGDLLRGNPKFSRAEIFPLYGMLSMEDQNRVFKRGQRRRVILATNVAETSITIPGIRFVVDTGLVRMSRFHPKTQVQGLEIERISQASAKQRRGRCGRTSDGLCLRLYSEEDHAGLPPFTDPEIVRSSLAGVILQMAAQGLPPVDEFPFLDPPKHPMVREGYQTLFDIGAVDSSRHLTPLGRQISSLPLDPRLGKILIQSFQDGVSAEILVLVSFLSLQDPRERPFDRRDAADLARARWRCEKSDFISILNLWNFLAKERAAGVSNSRLLRLCRDNFLNYHRTREWRDLCFDLSDNLKGLGLKTPTFDKPLEDEHHDLLHRCLLSGFPMNFGRFDKEKALYEGPRGRKFQIFPGSDLKRVKPPWIMAFAIVQTDKSYARNAAGMEPAWLEQVAPHLCSRTYENPRWTPDKGHVYATETVLCGGFVVSCGRNVHFGAREPAEARRIFISDGLATANINSRHPALLRHKTVLADVSSMEIKIRRPDSLLDPDAVFDHFDRILPDDVCSTKSFEAWLDKSKPDIAITPAAAMFEAGRSISPDDFPDHIEISGHRFPLRYEFEPGSPTDGATLSCAEDTVGLIPEWLPTWPPPGLIADKARALLKAAPKDVRTAVGNIEAFLDAFQSALDSSELNDRQPFLHALCDSIETKTGVNPDPDSFDTEKIPPHLTLNIELLRPDGRRLKLTRGMPGRAEYSSGVGAAVRSIRKWMRPPSQDWPGAPLPPNVKLDDKGLLGYPALVDDGAAVSARIFMDSKEADASHRLGLAQLFRIKQKRLADDLERHLPLAGDTLLELLIPDPDGFFYQDFVDAAILEPLTDSGRNLPRDADAFAAAMEKTRGLLHDSAKRLGVTIDAATATLARTRTILESDPARIPPESADDLRRQTDFLFREGFLRSPMVASEYRRFAKALDLRLNRLGNAPAKDAAKLAPALPILQRFDEMCDASSNLNADSDLLDLGFLLEEFRVSLFAPEVGASCKISMKRVEEAFADAARKRKTH